MGVEWRCVSVKFRCGLSTSSMNCRYREGRKEGRKNLRYWYWFLPWLKFQLRGWKHPRNSRAFLKDFPFPASCAAGSNPFQVNTVKLNHNQAHLVYLPVHRMACHKSSPRPEDKLGVRVITFTYSNCLSDSSVLFCAHPSPSWTYEWIKIYVFLCLPIETKVGKLMKCRIIYS